MPFVRHRHPTAEQMDRAGFPEVLRERMRRNPGEWVLRKVSGDGSLNFHLPTKSFAGIQAFLNWHPDDGVWHLPGERFYAVLEHPPSAEVFGPDCQEHATFPGDDPAGPYTLRGLQAWLDEPNE